MTTLKTKLIARIVYTLPLFNENDLATVLEGLIGRAILSGLLSREDPETRICSCDARGPDLDCLTHGAHLRDYVREHLGQEKTP